jgi:hypothetical protein
MWRHDRTSVKPCRDRRLLPAAFASGTITVGGLKNVWDIAAWSSASAS